VIVNLVITILLILLFSAASWRLFYKRKHIGSAAVGMVYGALNEDRRNAVELIVEERAEERDPETADGNLPDLESPDSSRRS
jgi:hypothetical protein